MSEENLMQFMLKVTQSEELQAKIGEEIDTEALIALGAECGFEFNDHEWLAVVGHRNTIVAEIKERKADRRRTKKYFSEAEYAWSEHILFTAWINSYATTDSKPIVLPIIGVIIAFIIIWAILS